MIKNRDLLLAALVMGILSVVLMILSIRPDRAEGGGDGWSAPLPEAIGIGNAEDGGGVTTDREIITVRDLFSPSRGRRSPTESAAVADVGNPAPVPEPELLNRLPNYPNDWPRFKLTGVVLVDGRLTALIAGGPDYKVSSGDKFPRHYTTGDTLGGGVSLHRIDVDDRRVELRRGNDLLTVKLGVEPPEVPKK